MRLRTKLLASFLLVVAVTGCVISAVSVRFMDGAVTRQAHSRVGHDLELAIRLYNSRLEEIRTAIIYTSIRPITVSRALMRRDRQMLGQTLLKVRSECTLDVLGITDPAGRVVLRSHIGSAAGDDVSDYELIAAVLKERKPLAATQVWTAERMQQEGLVADPQAHGQRNAAGGLLMMAAAPVLNSSGELAGVIYGGDLLNNECDRQRRPLVDRMRDAILRPDNGGAGTVAILQGNAVISTSLVDADGSRALGPLNREDIERAVLIEGSRWQGRCLAGGGRYIAACEPLRDVNGRTVGMIRVGLPEEGFTAARRKAALIFSGVTVAGMAVAVGISFVLASGILRPLRELATGVSQLSNGNLDYRVKINSLGPLKKLAETFNRMGESIKERDEQITKDAREMMEAKRLATLGQLAAGVAHEINNPLGGITVYAHLLFEDLPAGDPRADNLGKIINEAGRCKKIVKGLLDYSRQSGAQKESADINSILGAAVGLVAQQEAFGKVTVSRRLASDLPLVEVDVSQIEEVFTNILLNAAEAMGGEGDIEVETFVSGGGDKVAVRISDAGPGIPPENLGQIFEPFFTSKETGHGTGLGLAISYGIVENHEGTLRAENNPGGGATFIVELPLSREETTPHELFLQHLGDR